jgi:glyoxylase-like metal-dependent hydrolase (beta-lactamase superfamily II)
VHRWSVGTVEVVRIEDLDFAVPSDDRLPAWCVPHFAPSRDEVGVAFSALAISSEGTRIVVDPWLANDGPRELADAAEHADRLLDELADAGFPADDVDVVVNTHLDGIGWNTRPTDEGWEPSFPNARYLYPSDEIIAIERGEELYGSDGYFALSSTTAIDPVEPPLRLTSTVSLEAAPGHNFGHVAVRIESEDELAIYPGHQVLSPRQLADPTLGDEGNPWRDQAIATRTALLDELADRQGLLLTTLLGGPGGGTVRRNGGGFELVVER